jgi:Uma2 family endonuclease
MDRALRSKPAVDATVYPTEEKLGEDILQRLIMEVLRPIVEAYLKAKRVKAFVGADQFIYFRRGDTRGRVAPDVYVLPGVDPKRRVRSWKTWEEGIAPCFAVEVVSLDVDKDYIDVPSLYNELGIDELIVFDPSYEEESNRFRFQLFRRIAKRGLVRVDVTNEDRIRSKYLGCYVRAVGKLGETRLRLSTGPSGSVLIKTDVEHERAEKEYERAEKERERAEKEHERALRVAAQAELEALRGALAGKRAKGVGVMRKKPKH